MTLGVTLPLVAIGVAAAKVAIDFETAFTGVEKTVTGTTEQMEMLRAELESLATSGASPVSSLKNAQIELFKMAEAAGQLGIARKDIAEFVDVMGQLAMSTNIIGEEGSRQLARFANVTKFDLSGVRNLGDVIVELGNSLATTESEILTFGQRLGTLANVGLEAEEILAWGGAMSSLGIRAELGGTNFSKGVRAMAIAAATGGAKLDSLARVAGTTADEFAKLMSDDPTSAIQQFIAGISRLSLEDKVAALDDLGLKGERARTVFLTLASNTELVADAMNLASEAIEGNGALLDEAKKRAETTAGQLNLLRNNIAQLANEFGEILLPVINEVVAALLPMVRAFTALPEPIKKNIVRILALVAAIGPLLLIGGKLLALFSSIQAAVGLLSVALPAVGAAIAAVSLPVVAVIAGIAALGVALFLLVKNWDKVSAAINKFMIGLGRLIVEGLGGGIVKLFNLGKNLIGALINGIKTKIKELILTVFKMSQDVTKAIGKAFGIKSPSTEMMRIGRQITAGLNNGLAAGFQEVNQNTRGFATEMMSILTRGDFLGTGGFAEDSPVSVALFKMREDMVLTGQVWNQTAAQMQLAGQRLNQTIAQAQQQARQSVLSPALRRVATATRNGSRINGAAVSRIQQGAVSRINRGAQAAAASLNLPGHVSGRGGSGFVSGRGGSGVVSGRGGSGYVRGFQVGTMNINVPHGTTREQTDAIMREMGRQAKLRGARGF